MQDMGYRLWDAGPSDPAPGRHFPMPLTWSSLARVNWCLHGAFPVCKAADRSRSGAVCFGALQSSAAVQEGCAVCIRSLQLCMLLHGPFATTGLQAGGVQHVVGVAGGNKGARSWGCKKETVQQGAGGCKTQASCSMQLGLQGANSAASSCGLQEATVVQQAAGIARSNQGAACSWDCKKQAGCNKLGLQEANSAASNWGCRKQQWCCMQLGLREANSAASSCGLLEATVVQQAAGVARSNQAAVSSCGLQEATRVQEAGVARSKQCSKQLGWQEATGVLHATGVARSK